MTESGSPAQTLEFFGEASVTDPIEFDLTVDQIAQIVGHNQSSGEPNV